MNILSNYQDKINGVLSTFDRMIFKGHLGFLYRAGDMSYFLNKEGILMKDFPAYAAMRIRHRCHVQRPGFTRINLPRFG